LSSSFEPWQNLGKRSTILGGILVVDDHPVIAKACGLVLEPVGVETIVSAYDVDTGYQAFLEHEPEVSVIDLSLHGNELDGITLIRRIRSRNASAKILVFSMRSDRSSFVAAIEAGATGYLIKDSPTDEFAKAVQKTRLGRRYIDPQLALNLAFPKNAALSARERRILDLLLEDAPGATIGQSNDDGPREEH
jgi:two-component system, NarL family, invasion response regulator UvrY